MLHRLKLTQTVILLGLFGFLYLHLPTANGAEEENSNEEETADYPRPVISVEALETGETTANSLSREAEYCVHNEQFDQAIKLSRMALAKNSDDNEIHQIYALALEGKLSGQTNRDPSLYKQCVKEWLIVFRQEV